MKRRSLKAASAAVAEASIAISAVGAAASNAADATQALIEVLPPAKSNSWAKQKKARQIKSMKEKIETALVKNDHVARVTGEAIIISTGQLCYDLPWISSGPRPWRDGYTRVLIPLKTPTAKGHMTMVQIVKNSNLSHGRHS